MIMRQRIFMRLAISSILFLTIILVSGCMKSTYETTKVIIGGEEFLVEIADTSDKRSLGLSGRSSIDDRTGMLFVFDQPTNPAFWMKNMLIPIDIIWISNTTVVGFEEKVRAQPAGEELKRYRPGQLITHVLEVPAGTVESYGITIGSTINILDK